MKKCSVLVPALALLAACNLMKKTGDSAGDGGVTTADSASTTGTLVQKAMSFLGAGPFEGEITMNMTNASKPPETIVYLVKGTKMRFDTPAGTPGNGYVIFESGTKKMTTVSDAQKTAMVIDMNGPVSDLAGATKKPTIDKTGKTDTLAGYSCDIWKVTEDNGEKGEVCVAKGIAFPSMGKQAGWMAELDNSFPLRAVMNDAAGKETRRIEVTKIDKKSIDDAKFQVPVGYKTTNMDEMLKGLGGMARPRR